MDRLTARQICEILKLEPHPVEGGRFAQTYQSVHKVAKEALPMSYSGARPVGTAIYYLLTPETFSELHRLPGDEIFHFYLGDPLELLELRPDGTSAWIVLGQDIVAGMRPQHVVPAGVWQGSRLLPRGEYALLGTTMAPGFDPADYQTGSREKLIAEYPELREQITNLTRR